MEKKKWLLTHPDEFIAIYCHLEIIMKVYLFSLEASLGDT